MDEWKNYYDLTNPENSKFPNPWYDKLSDFQRILVVRTIRPDKVIPIVTKLIEAELGQKFIYPPPFDINKSYNDSNCLSPLIFILSPGVDPMASLLKFADQQDQADNLQSVSLGQGQVIYERPKKITLLIYQNRYNWRHLRNSRLGYAFVPSPYTDIRPVF